MSAVWVVERTAMWWVVAPSCWRWRKTDSGKNDLTRRVTHREAVLGRWSIAYLTRGTMKSYGPAHWLDYYDTCAIMCAWYYTSCCIQQTWNKTAKCTSLHAPKYALKYTPDCTRLYTPSLLDLHSQPAWLTLSRKRSRRSQSHSRARSQVYSQLHSMARSQPARLYAPK